MPLKKFIFLFCCFFTPYLSYAFISQERSFEILTDQTSQLEVKLLNDFYFKLSDLIIIIDTSFEEIDSLAGKINIEGFTNDDFILKTSKLISQAEEKISNLQNEYTLISRSRSWVRLGYVEELYKIEKSSQ